MKKSGKYYVGLFIGNLISTIIILYALYNGYQNFKDNKSLAADIALLFCFFTWQKVSRLQYGIADLITAIAYRELANEKEKE